MDLLELKRLHELIVDGLKANNTLSTARIASIKRAAGLILELFQPLCVSGASLYLLKSKLDAVTANVAAMRSTLVDLHQSF